MVLNIPIIRWCWTSLISYQPEPIYMIIDGVEPLLKMDITISIYIHGGSSMRRSSLINICDPIFWPATMWHPECRGRVIDFHVFHFYCKFEPFILSGSSSQQHAGATPRTPRDQCCWFGVLWLLRLCFCVFHEAYMQRCAPTLLPGGCGGQTIAIDPATSLLCCSCWPVDKLTNTWTKCH